MSNNEVVFCKRFVSKKHGKCKRNVRTHKSTDSEITEKRH